MVTDAWLLVDVLRLFTKGLAFYSPDHTPKVQRDNNPQTMVEDNEIDMCSKHITSSFPQVQMTSKRMAMHW